MMNLYEFVQLAIWPGEDSIKCHPFNVSQCVRCFIDIPRELDFIADCLGAQSHWIFHRMPHGAVPCAMGTVGLELRLGDVGARMHARTTADWDRWDQEEWLVWWGPRMTSDHESIWINMTHITRPYDPETQRGGWQFISNCLCEKHRTVNFMESLMQQVQRFFMVFRDRLVWEERNQTWPNAPFYGPHFMGDTADVPTGCCGSKVWIQWSCSQCHQVNSICSKRRGWVRVKWWCLKKLGYPKSWMVKPLKYVKTVKTIVE